MCGGGGLVGDTMSTCLHCGDGLTGQKQFYCSNRCRRTAKRKRRYAKYRQTKPCRVCGNELPKWRSKYCSQHCRETAAVTQYRTNYVNKYVKKARLLRDCINCGQQFETLNSRFCSSKCRYQHRDRNRPRAKKTDRQRNREYYFRADLLTKRRERRALMLAARAVYQELVGAVVKQKLLVTLAAAAPLVEIGNWSSYIVLPSRIDRVRKRSNQLQELLNQPWYLSRGELAAYFEKETTAKLSSPLLARDGWISYVVHRKGPWTPWVNKTPGLKKAGSYSGCKIAFNRHISKRKDRSYPKKYYPNNQEQRRIKQRTDNDILTAFKELNLLPTEE